MRVYPFHAWNALQSRSDLLTISTTCSPTGSKQITSVTNKTSRPYNTPPRHLSNYFFWFGIHTAGTSTGGGAVLGNPEGSPVPAKALPQYYFEVDTRIRRYTYKRGIEHNRHPYWQFHFGFVYFIVYVKHADYCSSLFSLLSCLNVVSMFLLIYIIVKVCSHILLQFVDEFMFLMYLVMDLKESFLFYYCVPHKTVKRHLLSNHANIRHLLDSDS